MQGSSQVPCHCGDKLPDISTSLIHSWYACVSTQNVPGCLYFLMEPGQLGSDLVHTFSPQHHPMRIDHSFLPLRVRFTTACQCLNSYNVRHWKQLLCHGRRISWPCVHWVTYSCWIHMTSCGLSYSRGFTVQQIKPNMLTMSSCQAGDMWLPHWNSFFIVHFALLGQNVYWAS